MQRLFPPGWIEAWAYLQDLGKEKGFVDSPYAVLTAIQERLPGAPEVRNIHQVCSSTEKAMAPQSSTRAWKIPWTEEPGRLLSMGSLRVGHDWTTSFSLFTFMHWRRKWQPTPVFLPGESQGWGSLVGCCFGSHRVGHDWSNLAAAAAALLTLSGMRGGGVGPRCWLGFRCFITEPQSVSARSFYIHRSRRSPPSNMSPPSNAPGHCENKEITQLSGLWLLQLSQDSALGKICPIWEFRGFSVLLSDSASRRVSLYGKI